MGRGRRKALLWIEVYYGYAAAFLFYSLVSQKKIAP
jgi:hypothetical protein